MRTFLAILVLLILPFGLFAYTSPGEPTGFVNDFAQVLQTDEVLQLETQLTELKQKTGAEVAVVTIPTLGNETVETYAEKLFQEWGIGSEDRDTGLLILVAIADREMRIEVGYGLEGAVTDLQSGNIIRKIMVPAFQEGKYAEGISGAIDALEAIITASPEAAQYSEQESPAQTSTESGSNFSGFFVIAIILINIFSHIFGKTKSWWLGGVVGASAGAIIGFIWGFISIGLISIIGLTVLGFIFDFIVSKHPPRSGPGGFGGWGMGGRRGSSGRGFGGFGGGRSGGGGASGKW